MWYEPLLENGLIPDVALRAGIRRQLRARLRQQRQGTTSHRLEAFVDELRRGPIATHTDAANSQHYEVPSDFYRLVLGPRWKYSSGYWQGDDNDLASSELSMLELYVERARLEGSERILDLGCGWGSLSLFLAERFPRARIVAVSNSATQKAHIDTSASSRGFDNLEVVTADINGFTPNKRFDRVLSIEMFEHMSNFHSLLQRIAGWLDPGGLLFVHHFAHRDLAYPFEAGAASEWMAKHFFSGGIMPSADLLDRFPDHMGVVERWHVNGRHYQRTCEAWLERLGENRVAVLDLLADAYGPDQARKHFNYWRIFFMACAELFGYRRGSEWSVVHSLLAPRPPYGENTSNPAP